MTLKSTLASSLYVITLPMLMTTPPIQATTTSSEPLQVVASFSIIADMAKQVGADRVAITSLVGPDGDAHVYEPKPADAIAISQADIVLVNGLSFEGFLPRLVKASRTNAPIAALTDGINALANTDHGHSHNEEHDHHHHHHGKYDPHAWQSVHHAQTYVNNIATAFCSVDTDGCDSYQTNAKAYVQQLEQLDQEIHDSVNDIPEAQRIVITSHDAFNYFEHDYGIQFLAVEGLSTEAEASAADVAKLSNQIKEGGASALFLENMANPRLVEQIARETDIAIGGTLYSDALSKEDGPAATYLDMMRHNVNTIKKAIRKGQQQQ